MRVPASQILAAAWPTARAIRPAQPALMLGLAVLLVAWRADTLDTPSTAVWTVRVVALVLVAGALPAFDDPAATQVWAVPLTLAWRMLPRIVLAVAYVAVLLVPLAGSAGLPGGQFVLETGALFALAAAACLLFVRRGVLEPSTPVAVGLLLVPPALVLLPERAVLLVPPGPQWDPAHVRWAILLGVGVLLVAHALRDPARPHAFRRPPTMNRRHGRKSAGARP